MKLHVFRKCMPEEPDDYLLIVNGCRAWRRGNGEWFASVRLRLRADNSAETIGPWHRLPGPPHALLLEARLRGYDIS